MKKLLLFITFFSVSLMFYSCEKEKTFDEKLLIGKWRSGTEFYKYFKDHTGGTWDTSDDVQEDEALPFEWTLNKSELQHIHIMEMGGKVPKYYSVTSLTATSLKYKDSFGKSFSFVKVNE